MSRRRGATIREPGRRAQREARLGQFELPSFAAGMTVSRLETIERLLAAREARHGRDAYTDRIEEEVRAAMMDAQRWQAMAAVMTEYPYRREED